MAPVDILNLFKQYLAAFNREDIAAIADMLDADVEVVVNGASAAMGRDSILPSYEKDFAAGKKVSIGVEPFIVDGEQDVVQVGLVAVEPGASGTTTLSVKYHYNSEGRQIRHEIFDIMVKPD